MNKENLLQVDNLKMHFTVHGGILYRQIATVFAVDGVSFALKHGKTLGLVGESGCGKSTVGRALLRLYDPTDGQVQFDGKDITRLHGQNLRALRLDMQMIFQDPFESLNPRHTIGDILEEPFIIHKMGKSAERRKEVLKLLDKVGMPADAVHKYPHEFSGGQRQRIGIARSIALKPKLVICDEPVSALDVSVQAQILNLLEDLKAKYSITLVFIAHDLAVVKNISDRVVVMYLGKMCEVSESDELYAHPAHPYTRLLMESHPEPDPHAAIDDTISAEGELPSPINPPSGCRFRTRCPLADQQCVDEEPQMRRVNDEHFVACHHPLIDIQPVEVADT